MHKIFFTGSGSINNELKNLFYGKAEVQNKIEPTIEFIFDSCNFPFDEKIKNLQNIEAQCSKDCVILSSTLCNATHESIPHLKNPSRVIGIGLYDSFSTKKFVELAQSKLTNKNIVENVQKFFDSIEVKTSIVPDKPGLVFPRILCMIINEAAQVYSEKIANREDIDTAMKLGTNYPFGPLEWADKLGIDLVHNILESLQRTFGEDRYRPHPLLKEMVNLNQLGVKTKKGFYEY